MTIVELSEVLGNRVRIAQDTSLSDEERLKEMAASQQIVSLAKQMINAADVVLRIDKLQAEGKFDESSSAVRIRG